MRVTKVRWIMQVRGEARANVYYMTTPRVKKITPRSVFSSARDRLRKFVDNLTPTGLVCECFALVDGMIFPGRVMFSGWQPPVSGAADSGLRYPHALSDKHRFFVTTSASDTPGL